MRKSKLKKIPNPNTRHIVVTVRFNPDEMKMLLAHAHAYERGDISKWIRLSSVNYKPKK